MKHLVGEVHQPRDHLNICHPKAGYTYSRMTADGDGPEFYDCEYSSVRPRTVGYSPGHNRSMAVTPSQGSLISAGLTLGSPTTRDGSSRSALRQTASSVLDGTA